MLREIRTHFLRPRIMYGQITTSGGNSVARDIGADDISSATEPSAGRPTLNFKQQFGRAPFIFGQPSTSAANGSFIEQFSAPAVGSAVLGARNTAGTYVDQTIDYLVAGYEVAETNRMKIQRALCTRRNSRAVWGKITGASGVVSIGGTDFTCTRTSQGVYNITFRNPFGSTPSVFITTINTSIRAARTSSKTVSSVTVTIYDATPAVQDSDFYILVIGSASKEVRGTARDLLMNSQRKPRIVLGRVTWTAGTPAYTVNSGEFSGITDQGTGDATVTLVDAFARECAVFGCALSGARIQVRTASASAPRIIALTAAGAAVDPTSANLLLIGSDDATQF